MISDARTQARDDEVAPAGATAVGAPATEPGDGADGTGADGNGADGTGAPESRRTRRRRERAEREDAAADSAAGTADGDRPRRRSALWGPLVAVLAVLLLLLLGGVGYLWFTRPAASSVSTGDYVGVLTQGRQDVVDLTSFDYQTLDQDIAQVRSVSVGQLQKDSVDLLQKGRQQFTDQQVVVNTEVVSAAVTQAGDGTGRLMLVIQSTQTTKASSTPKVSRYRIQADLKKVGDRWLLTGITGR